MEKLVSQKEVSTFIRSNLDKIGFDQKSIRERGHLVKKLSEAKDVATKIILDNNNIEKIFVGSQREGIGFNHCNDLDVLQINHGVGCLENVHFANTANGAVIFEIVQQNVPPGYVHLKLFSKGKTETFQPLEYALVERNGDKYLSSEVFMTKNKDIYQDCTGYIGENTCYLPREGPSIPKHTKTSHLENEILSCLKLETKHTDVVNAFPCEANSFIEAWKMRQQKSHWLSPKTIAHVGSLPALVVPVGQRGSQNDDLQWRVCFTKAEIHLVDSFNEIQMKIFLLLKFIAKYLLQPNSKAVTSFVVKNVVFWISEEIPAQNFCQEHLVPRLKDAIQYLKDAVERKQMPCYFIPTRNLFEGKLKDNEGELIAEKLDFLLKHGVNMVARYISQPETIPKELQEVIATIKKVHEIDKTERIVLASFTKEQIAEKYVEAFFYQSQSSSVNHLNIWFNTIQFLNIYARMGFLRLQSVTQSSKEESENDFEQFMHVVSNCSDSASHEPHRTEADENMRQWCLFDLSCFCV